MLYPKYLFPKRYFKKFSVEELTPQSEDYLIVRKSLKRTFAETFDRLGMVKKDSLINIDEQTGKFRLREIPGLSNYILGAFFKIKHLKFRPKNNASKDWDHDVKISFKEIASDIVIHEYSPVPIFFRISKIHKQSFPFCRPRENSKKKLPDQLITSSVPAPKATTELLHKPTVCNFWHFEFHIKDDETGEYFESKKVSSLDENRPVDQQKPGTQIALHALDIILMENASDKAPKIEGISPKVYLKSNNWIVRQFLRIWIKLV